MKHQLALVTGATSGIGEALCHLLAGQGIHLIASGRSQERLHELKENLSLITTIQIVACDLENEEQRRQLIEMIHQQSPDLIINNAGWGLYGEALTYSTSEQLAILDVNARAVLELTLEAARTLVSYKKSGVVLNVSSAAAFQIFPGMAVYAAAKGFVNQVSLALDYEFKAFGIRVLTACPGMVATQFQKRASGNFVVHTKIEAMSTKEVTELMWRQIQNQSPLVVMNWKYRLLNILSRFIPQSWLTKQLSQDILARINPRRVKEI